MKFSVKTQGFYSNDNDYGENLPADAINITEKQYRDFYSGLNENRHIYLSDEGLKLSDIKPDNYHSWDNEKNRWVLSDEAATQQKKDAITSANNKKESLMAAAAVEIAPLQDAVDLGMASDEEKSLLNKWKVYRVLLNRIDTALAPDINWPEKPE